MDTSSITFTASSAEAITLQCMVTNLTGSATSDQKHIEIAPALAKPIITAPEYVTSNQSGYGASVTEQSNAAYSWTMTGGTITDGADTSSITFMADSAETITLQCTISNAADSKTSDQKIITIVDAPQNPIITAPASVAELSAGNAASVQEQIGVTYSWTIDGGTITDGANTSSITFTASSAETITLQCMVTNLAGTTVSSGETTVHLYVVAREVSLGTNHSCAVSQGGAAKCWGINFPWSLLGNGTVGIGFVPTDVVGLNSGVASVTAASQHSCALMETGGIKCWRRRDGRRPPHTCQCRWLWSVIEQHQNNLAK